MDYIVITNTFNRKVALVERSLRASLSQKYPAKKVILIDQNEEDILLPDDVMNNPVLEIQKNLTTSVSTARNNALRPESDWIVFCDDDGFMKDNYSETLVQIIKDNPDTSIFAGSILRDDHQGFYTPRHAIGGDLNKFKNTKLLMGSNFALKSKVFEQLKGFDEDFGTGGKWGSGEESDFAWKAYFNKIKMKYCKELVIYHIKPYSGTLKQSTKKAFLYGVGKGALVSKWLFHRKKMVVLLELSEMILVPFIRSIVDLFKLNPSQIFIHTASLCGRLVGLIKNI